MAVMNVWDRVAAQSPRQLHMPKRVQRARYTEIVRTGKREEYLKHFDFFKSKCIPS